MALKISDHGLFEASNTTSKTLTCWTGYNSEETTSFTFYLFLFLTFQKKFLFRLTLCLTTKTKKKKIFSIEQRTAGPKISNVCTMDSSFFRLVEHWITHIAFPGYWGELSYQKLITQTRFFESTPSVQFSSVQSLSCVRLFATPWIAACQASLLLLLLLSRFSRVQLCVTP